jgi:replicative DNA helicase
MNTLAQAEHNVIGSMIFDPRAVIPIAAEILKPYDFYSPRFAKVFHTLVQMVDVGEDVTFITVADKVKDEVSAAELAEISADALPAYVKAHAEIIKRESRRRSFILFAKKAIEELESGADLAETAGRMDDVIRKISDRPNGRSMRELLQEAIEDITLAEQGGADDDMLETGISDLDKMLGGFKLKYLIIVAGRPGMGKTAISVNIAQHVGRTGKSVLFFTMESRDHAIVNRMLSSESEINNARVQTRRTLTNSESDQLKKIAASMMNLPIKIRECREWETIKAAIRAEKRRDENLSLVVIDYAQLVRVSIRTERYLQIAEISGDCKALAMELNLCVLLCSQLNRDLERREDKRPVLPDLRESGNLEQDGDVILLLYRPCKYDPKQNPYLAEVDCAKNRDGSTGIISLRFDESIVKFS